MSAASPAATSGQTVTVASKFPLPIRLHLQKKITAREVTADGTVRAAEAYVKDGNKTFVVDGCARRVGEDTDKTIVGGFALTHGVPADFWEAWVKQNEEFPPYANGLIFAAPKNGTADGMARERKDFRSGFEPLDPKHWPAEFVGVKADA